MVGEKNRALGAIGNTLILLRVYFRGVEEVTMHDANVEFVPNPPPLLVAAVTVTLSQEGMADFETLAVSSSK